MVKEDAANQRNGAIAYRYSSPAVPNRTIYINIISNYTCVNDCDFCSRPRGKHELGKKNIYEEGAGVSLYLEKSPDVHEVMTAIAREYRADDVEFAFVGPGEPLMYLDKVCDIIQEIRRKYQVRVRIDTNGIAGMLSQDAPSRLHKAGLDEVRISVNAVNEAEYNALCRPSVKDMYEGVLRFLKGCKSLGIDTKASFVSGYHLPGAAPRSDLEYIRYSKSLGISRKNVILRAYNPPA